MDFGTTSRTTLFFGFFLLKSNTSSPGAIKVKGVTGDVTFIE